MGDFCYDFPILKRVLAQAEHMDRVMDKIGVNPVIAIRADGGGAWYEARTRCIDCTSDSKCRAWLDARRSEGPLDAPEFCPNREFFDACRLAKA